MEIISNNQFKIYLNNGIINEESKNYLEFMAIALEQQKYLSQESFSYLIEFYNICQDLMQKQNLNDLEQETIKTYQQVTKQMNALKQEQGYQRTYTANGFISSLFIIFSTLLTGFSIAFAFLSKLK